jgi:predicted transcriptional regulator
MSTTTIRIDDELKARIGDAAAATGKSAHAFIVEAIVQTVERVEQDEELHRVAEERWSRLLATGKSVPWDEARAYLQARARGERPRRPVARKAGR